jgi:hypothetical protein
VNLCEDRPYDHLFSNFFDKSTQASSTRVVNPFFVDPNLNLLFVSLEIASLPISALPKFSLCGFVKSVLRNTRILFGYRWNPASLVHRDFLTFNMLLKQI